MTSSKIFERGTFCGTMILQIRRSEGVAFVLAHNQDFAERRELKPPPKLLIGLSNISNEQTSVSQTYHRRGSRGAAPATGKFFVIFCQN